MDLKDYLSQVACKNDVDLSSLQLPSYEVDRTTIKVIMISEVPPSDAEDGFYSSRADAEYVRSAIGLFKAAGVNVSSMSEILDMGVYITTAIKTPKSGYIVEPGILRSHLPILRAELALFPNLKVIMLMGDVAKKAVNMITKAETKKNVIPTGATGRLRHNEYFWGDIRVIPSYIMTGKNLLIEPFKRDCIVEAIVKMMEVK